MRHAGLLDDRVPGPERDLGTAYDERHFPSQHGDVVQRLGGVRFLEAVVPAVEVILVRCVTAAAVIFLALGRDLDDPEAGSAPRRLQRPFPGRRIGVGQPRRNLST